MLFFFYTCLVLFIITCLFLILLILIQKGRGGGLSGAFGGAGGNTAFGSKTGDVLTWATSIVFGVFLLLAVVLNLIGNAMDRRGATVAGNAPLVSPAPVTGAPGQLPGGMQIPTGPAGPTDLPAAAPTTPAAPAPSPGATPVDTPAPASATPAPSPAPAAPSPAPTTK
jgi:preprotein translocase subunit SecG